MILSYNNEDDTSHTLVDPLNDDCLLNEVNSKGSTSNNLEHYLSEELDGIKLEYLRIICLTTRPNYTEECWKIVHFDTSMRSG